MCWITGRSHSRRHARPGVHMHRPAVCGGGAEMHMWGCAAVPSGCTRPGRLSDVRLAACRMVSGRQAASCQWRRCRLMQYGHTQGTWRLAACSLGGFEGSIEWLWPAEHRHTVGQTRIACIQMFLSARAQMISSWRYR